jgi:hypothetical protein
MRGVKCPRKGAELAETPLQQVESLLGGGCESAGSRRWNIGYGKGNGDMRTRSHFVEFSILARVVLSSCSWKLIGDARTVMEDSGRRFLQIKGSAHAMWCIEDQGTH